MSLRRLRLRAPWLLVVPFFLLVSPTERALAVGGVLAAVGLAIRAWAAGTIDKGERLVTEGPYAYVRHPLYLGSLFIGVGLTIAGGHWVWPALFLLFFVPVYGGTMRRESERLAEAFGGAYREYMEHVPGLRPRVRPYRAAPRASGERAVGFSWARYLRNREWEALLGAIAGFGLLLWMGVGGGR